MDMQHSAWCADRLETANLYQLCERHTLAFEQVLEISTFKVGK